MCQDPIELHGLALPALHTLDKWRSAEYLDWSATHLEVRWGMGKTLDSRWHLDGIYMESRWNLHGIYMESGWTVYKPLPSCSKQTTQMTFAHFCHIRMHRTQACMALTCPAKGPQFATPSPHPPIPPYPCASTSPKRTDLKHPARKETYMERSKEAGMRPCPAERKDDQLVAYNNRIMYDSRM